MTLFHITIDVHMQCIEVSVQVLFYWYFTTHYRYLQYFQMKKWDNQYHANFKLLQYLQTQ